MTELVTFDISIAYAVWYALWRLHRGSRKETDKWIKECKKPFLNLYLSIIIGMLKMGVVCSLYSCDVEMC